MTQTHPPQRQPTRAPQRSNRTVLIVILAVVAVVTGGLGVWLLSSPSYDLSTARGATEAFVSAANDRDLTAVRSLMCSQDRDDVSGELNQAAGMASFDIVDVSESGDRATATIKVSAIVGSRQITLPLVKSDSTWAVCPSAERSG